MSTDLVKIATDDAPLALFTTGNEDIAEVMEANLAGAEIELHSLPQAITPSGGGTQFKIEDGGTGDRKDEVIGVPLGWFPDGRLWGSEEMSDGQPVLVTHDLKTAYMVSDDIGDPDEATLGAAVLPDQGAGRRWYDLTKLAYCQWGSGKNGGKRAKEYRLVPILEEGALLPTVVRVSAASLKDVDRFRMNAFGLKPYYRCLVKASLVEVPKSGSTPAYSKVVFAKMPGELTKEQGLALKEMYMNPLAEKRARDILD